MKHLDETQDGYHLLGDVRKANFGDKIQRDILIQDALEQQNTDPYHSTFAVVVHPRLVSCVTPETILTLPSGETLTARTLTVEQVKTLPPEIGEAWSNAVYDVNPTWVPGYKPAPEPGDEKKS